MYEGEIQNEVSGRFEIKVTSGPDSYLLHVPTKMLPKGSRIGSQVIVETNEAGMNITVSELDGE